MNGFRNSDPSQHYTIVFTSHLDSRWEGLFPGMRMVHLRGGETLLSGPVLDQAALFGILRHIGDLGLQILLVQRSDFEFVRR